MKKLTGQQIRETWIKFFENRGHKWMEGVNLIPQGDDSLLWVNAGVTGLKKYFDGSEIPPCRRIVNVQKSIRTNDIENVGHTARHHTFFEMLGNFSIGDYFRKEVIKWAVEILTSEEGFGMPLDKLYMTYNPSDLESFRYWQENGVDKSHLIPLEDNYWQIGEGPCGPNTEVFFDRGEEWDPKHLGIKLLEDDIENDRYIEIWGIVFSQYNAVNGVKREDYKELPSKNIDTGAGLERIACILQHTPTNFETDLFMPIIEEAKKLSGKPYEGEYLMPYRVIADHTRCLSFALSDGAYFSNEGRGYVLRRIIRRAMRYGQKLGIMEPFMHKLVDVVAEHYKDFYPSVYKNKETVKKMIESEEEKFLKTLTQGEAMLRNLLSDHKDLSGEEIFKLYDTYGFPSELSKEIVEENGGKADMDGFYKCMEEQKERARNARGEIESFAKQSQDLLAFKEPSNFLYGETEKESEVIGTFRNGVAVEEITDEGELAFKECVFYAESGGQVSDSGYIESGSCKALVTAVSKAPAGQHLLHVRLAYGSIKKGDLLTQYVDRNKRLLTARNHSATHLLHVAITNVLGGHVDQRGSFVNDEYLRFDFTSLHALSDEQKRAIEKEVNEKIAEAIEQKTLILPIEEAKKLGAEMEFSEKYGDTVRVVTFSDYSKEFCGGTHVSNSQDIGLFVLESEEAISSGTRRITGLTSLGAISYLGNKRNKLDKIEEKFGGVSDNDVVSRLDSSFNELAKTKKELDQLKEKLSSSSAKKIGESFAEVSGIHFLFEHMNKAGRAELLRLGDNLKTLHQDYVIVLLGDDEKGHPCLALSGGKGKDKLPASVALKELSPILNGRGGGKDESASGQMADLSKLNEAKAHLLEKLS